eukprot:Skav225585  [mRNA]  locus=scaffold901:53486:56495:+ [translate_table: standard]
MPMPKMASSNEMNNMVSPEEPDSASRPDADSDLAARLDAQARQIVEQERRIKELERRFTGIATDIATVEKAEVVELEEDVEQPNNGNRASRARVDSATYAFDHSMWDAALLVL